MSQDKQQFSIFRVLVLLLPVVIVLGILWKAGILVPQPPAGNQEVIPRMVGLTDPVVNRLGEQFVDANEDLVADCPADATQLLNPEKLVFSYIAVEEAAEYKEVWQPFVEHLSKVTGKPVEYALWTSTNEQLKALRDGALHITGFNTGSVPLAVNQAGFVPVCKLPSADGTGSYHMELIVPADSLINSPSDLVSHELTLTNARSNSGYKAALVLLWSDFELKPGRDFDIRVSGDHRYSIVGVALGKYEAAAVASDLIERAIENEEIERGQYKTIYTSEPFPTACLGYVYNLTPDLAAKVREAFSTFDWGGTSLEGQIAAGSHTAFVPASYKDDWSLIRRIDDATGKKHKIDN